MKKRMMALVCCLCLALSMTACGDSKQTDTEEEGITRSGQYELDYDKLVTKLADYEAIDVAITETEDTIREAFYSYLTAYEEVTDHKEIQKEDYVLVDYTGYRDGTAFDGGAAKGQYVLVSNNNGYIDGFTDGLLGKKAGETTTYDVTFPETYPNNPDLAGVTVQFEFKIYGIYKTATVNADNITDEIVANSEFGSSYGVTTVAAFEEFVKSSYYNVKSSAVVKYMTENSEVTIPDEYLDLRVNEYISSGLANYTGSTEDEKWAYIEENYNVTKDTVYETLRSTITTEFVFAALARKMNIEFDEADYASFIETSFSGKTEDEIYSSLGAGNVNEGKVYTQNLYLSDNARSQLVDMSKYHYEEKSDK